MMFFEIASSGNFCYLYVAEVCVDSGAGFSSLGKYVNLLLMSVTHEYMINSQLQVYGTIWLYATLTMIGFFFYITVLKETRGLNDLEKKTLYSPKVIMHLPTEKLETEANLNEDIELEKIQAHWDI